MKRAYGNVGTNYVKSFGDNNSSNRSKRIRYIDDNIVQYDKNNNNLNRTDNKMPSMGGSPLLDILGMFKKEEITGEDNEIIFDDDVTQESVRDLISKINKLNRDFERAHATDNNYYIFPKPIYLHITSNGGDLLAGFMAYDVIKNSKIPIYTVVDAYAVSAGSVIYMAGKKRFMREKSYILIHQLNQMIHSRMTYAESLDNIVNCTEFMNKLYTIYLKDGNRHCFSPVKKEDFLTREILETHMTHDVFLNLETCIKYGLVDDIYTDYSDCEKKDRNEFYNKLVGKDIQLPTYDTVFRKFGLSTDADSNISPTRNVIDKMNSMIVKKNKKNRKNRKHRKHNNAGETQGKAATNIASILQNFHTGLDLQNYENNDSDSDSNSYNDSENNENNENNKKHTELQETNNHIIKVKSENDSTDTNEVVIISTRSPIRKARRALPNENNNENNTRGSRYPVRSNRSKNVVIDNNCDNSDNYDSDSDYVYY